MAQWAIANLNRTGQILQPASYDLLWQPYAEVGPEDPGALVGLSWFISSYKGQRTIDHSGGDIGFRTNFFLLPDRGEAVIVLANTVPAPVGQITNVLLDSLLGDEPQPPKPPLLMRLSQVLREQGLAAALQTYQQMKEDGLDAYEVDPYHFYDTGDLLREVNRLPEAIDIFKLGLAVHPESDSLYYGLALAYTRSGAKEQAIENLQRCLELNREHPEAIKLSNEL
jgi:tetratricopeptide (TPR) repeat protein